MKEVTYEDWQKNPTPRMMWVWDSVGDDKKQRKVIYISELGIPYPIFALTDDKLNTEHFKHCAEIESPKRRRMTKKELSWWLSEKPRRERKFTRTSYIYTYYVYCENEQDEEVPDDFLIREDGGEWREPLVDAVIRENDGEWQNPLWR